MLKRVLTSCFYLAFVLNTVSQIDNKIIYLNQLYASLNEGTYCLSVKKRITTALKTKILDDKKKLQLDSKKDTSPSVSKKIVKIDIPVNSPKKPPIKLWNNTFTGWTFGYKTAPFDHNLYWKILENGELMATGGRSYETQCGMRTDNKYTNYELTLEYKWLNPGKTEKTGNSGVWIHGQDGFTRSNGAYPSSIEVQLKKTAAGDLLRKGLEIDPEPGFPTEGEAIFRRTTTPVVEHFYNQWNILRIKCVKNEISVWLNGVFVNKAINCRTKSGTPVALGHITLQSEIDNVVFRNILLQTLD